jgi:hypothetical protein
VTSFNEWGEGTQIEPVEQYPPIPSQVIESVVTDEQLSGMTIPCWIHLVYCLCLSSVDECRKECCRYGQETNASQVPYI